MFNLECSYNPPFLFTELNQCESALNPLGIDSGNSSLTSFFYRYLMQQAMSVYKWTFPENWNSTYFLYTLYTAGYLAVIRTDKYGVIPQNCGLSGYTVQYQPAEVVIANPLFRAPGPLTIDRDCTLFKLTQDYRGLTDLVGVYAQLMSLACTAYATNTLNSRLAYVFAANNQIKAESFKKAADKVISGEPYIVIDKNMMGPDGKLNMQLFNNSVKTNFIGTETLDNLQTLKNMFLSAIGIDNANTQKKERLITDEVNANNGETKSLAGLWLKNLKKDCKKCKAMFGSEGAVTVNWADWARPQKGQKEVQPNEEG